MELDHIFIFTDSPAAVANSLSEFGLTEGTPNVHPGQGTRCRRFFFENAYLEFVSVISEEEIKHPAITETRLWERSQYKLTGYCPFGLCFRKEKHLGKDTMLLFQDGWKYKPPYLPEGHFVNLASNTFYTSEPMLFEMPFFNFAPKEYPLASLQPLNHEKAFKKITRVTLALPGVPKTLSGPMQLVLSSGILAISEDKDFSVDLEFDYCIEGKTESFNHLAPLSLSW